MSRLIEMQRCLREKSPTLSPSPIPVEKNMTLEKTPLVYEGDDDDLSEKMKTANGALTEWKRKYHQARDHRDAKDLLEANLRHLLKVSNAKCVTLSERIAEIGGARQWGMGKLREMFVAERSKWDKEHETIVESIRARANQLETQLESERRKYESVTNAQVVELEQVKLQLKFAQDKANQLSAQIAPLRSQLEQRTRSLDRLTAAKIREELLGSKGSKHDSAYEAFTKLADENKKLQLELARSKAEHRALMKALLNSNRICGGARV